MKNAGIAGGLVAIGLGLATIGLSNFSRNANAVPAAALSAGPEEPQIVWYSVLQNPQTSNLGTLFRAWSDGTIEARKLNNLNTCSTAGVDACTDWSLVSSPDEGLNAAADINLDEIVDGADLGVLLASWGAAPRGPVPLSDCPLGLMQ